MTFSILMRGKYMFSGSVRKLDEMLTDAKELVKVLKQARKAYNKALRAHNRNVCRAYDFSF